VRPDKTAIRGPMGMYVPGWSQMTDDDVKALAMFIKSIPPIENKVPAGDFKAPEPPGGGGPPAAPPAAP
jgi:hypothetical protein